MTEDRDHNGISWIKSSYSGSSGGQCVEWAPTYASAHGVVPVRDSKSAEGPAVSFEAPVWGAFIGALKVGALAKH
ncbi:DUF397 domain-containing protein [Streptomyces sp. NPDC055078]